MKRKGTNSSWWTNLLVLAVLGLAVPALCCVGNGGAGQGVSPARGDAGAKGAASDSTASTTEVTLEVTGMT